MKYDFTFYNPTRIHFGKNAMQKLPEELAAYGKNVMLLYGKGAIKRIGLYDEVVNILTACGKNIVECGGIKPNPSYAQVLEGARLVRENDVDLILAVGGGSVVDCAKAISVAAYVEGDAWQKYWVEKQTLQTPLLLTSQITRTQSRDCTLPLGRQKFIVVCLAKTLGVLLLDKRREDV